MISPREALALVLSRVSPGPAEMVALDAAAGRVLAADVVAGIDLPPFSNSQMDGYAVRSSDLAGAGADRPATLRVTGLAAAGRAAVVAVAPGTAVRVMTGAPLPEGADAVVKQEDVLRDGDAIRVGVAPSSGEFVRAAGEDVRAGECVLSRGRPLGAADVGLLAAVGRAIVPVSVRPRVAILSTGDEVVAPGEPLPAGCVYNSNAWALAAACRETGAEAVVLPIARDDREALREAVAHATSFDVALSIGGVSVGDFDHVKEAVSLAGVEQVFWRVAQKPGKPLVFGVRDGRLFFGLPGNPVSALVCFDLYVAPALRRRLGAAAIYPMLVEVEMAADVATAAGLTEFVRCTIAPGRALPRALPTASQSSGALRSLARADALVVSTPGQGRLAASEKARTILLGASRPKSE
ncbi:MAG: gephyrin-like molybdotransferase Glp [Alphaproteobacteria bacterium]